jgi:hypothetical protein
VRLRLALLVLVVALAACPRRRASHPPPAVKLTTDAAGRIFDGAGKQVGFTDRGGQAWVAVSRELMPIELGRARMGRLDGDAPILRLARGTALSPGTLVGALDDGRTVLHYTDGHWQPLDAALPSRGRARIQLDDGESWITLRFAGDGDLGAAAHWVMPAHSPREVADRARELEDECAHLPPVARTRVIELLPVMAIISTVEGRFGDPAWAGDIAASLGIFQWAMPRAGTGDTTWSLERFFARLKARAASGDKLARAAWRECTARGLDVRSGHVALHKKRVTGAALEAEMKDAMGAGALRTYQLVAARDWIDDVRQTVVRPGLFARQWLTVDYEEESGGRTITLGGDVTVTARAPATVGAILRSPGALATAVNLGVNRPRYVESALWRALVPDDAPARIARLAAALRGAPPAAKARKLTAELQSLLWPAPRLDAADELLTTVAFIERALEIYKPGERERRARRLACTLAAPSPSP